MYMYDGQVWSDDPSWAVKYTTAAIFSFIFNSCIRSPCVGL